jgi:tetratricopeptide (TPR) repeat protein
MNDSDRQYFNHLYEKLEAGPDGEGLQELRDFARRLDDPWEKAELIYHEVLFLLDLDNTWEARRRLKDLQKALSKLGESPADAYELDVSISLPVMARYAEARVAFAEGNERETLQFIKDLEARYPKQLSMPDFSTIRDVVGTLKGILLADAGQWAEARTILEDATPPEAWKGIHLAYLGRCYYRSCEYERAKDKLEEALKLKITSVWEGRIRYGLGLVEFCLSDKLSALRQFELALKMADSEYLEKSKIWEWLETTAHDLGLLDEAENYRKRRAASGSRPKIN